MKTQTIDAGWEGRNFNKNMKTQNAYIEGQKPKQLPAGFHSTTRPPEQHSPLPWTLYDGSDSHTFTIKSPWTDKHRPGQAEGYGDYRGLTICEIEHQGESAPVVTKRQARANAAYIVKACNEYPKLVKKLADAVPADVHLIITRQLKEDLAKANADACNLLAERNDLAEKCEQWSQMFDDKCKTLSRIEAQRDELLAALKEAQAARQAVGKMLPPCLENVIAKCEASNPTK